MKKIETLDDAFEAKVNAVRLKAYAATGYEWWVVSATRDIKEQHALYMKSRNGIDDDGDGLIDEGDERVTNADGGSSPHNFKKGCDIAPAKNGEIWWNAPKSLWKVMADIAKAEGLTPGYYFKNLFDAPHLEDPSWRKDQALWKAGKLKVT